MKNMKKILYAIWDIIEVFVIALIAVLAIKYFLIQPFIVNGASMEPNFYDGDYLIVDEISYVFDNPSRGDVVVFHAPQNYNDYFIKRIIGLPGERVVVDDNVVTIYNKEYPNGFKLDEKYLPKFSIEWKGYIDITLEKDEYFVLGDNRINSLDSRYWGPLKKGKIVGVVRVRLWPPKEVRLFNSPIYQLK